MIIMQEKETISFYELWVNVIVGLRMIVFFVLFSFFSIWYCKHLEVGVTYII